MSERNKEIVEKVNSAFLEGNFEGFLSFCAEDVEWTIVGDRTVKLQLRRLRRFLDLEQHPRRRKILL